MSKIDIDLKKSEIYKLQNCMDYGIMVPHEQTPEFQKELKKIQQYLKEEREKLLKSPVESNDTYLIEPPLDYPKIVEEFLADRARQKI